MVLSLVSRSNQNGSSKSNTAPLLTEAIVTDRNSYKNTSVTLLKLKLKFEQKLFENQKKGFKTEVIQFISEKDLHSNYVWVSCA